MPETVTGRDEFEAESPSPSWPYWLSPQHRTTPVESTAQVCENPQPTLDESAAAREQSDGRRDRENENARGNAGSCSRHGDASRARHATRPARRTRGRGAASLRWRRNRNRGPPRAALVRLCGDSSRPLITSCPPRRFQKRGMTMLVRFVLSKPAPIPYTPVSRVFIRIPHSHTLASTRRRSVLPEEHFERESRDVLRQRVVIRRLLFVRALPLARLFALRERVVDRRLARATTWCRGRTTRRRAPRKPRSSSGTGETRRASAPRSPPPRGSGRRRFRRGGGVCDAQSPFPRPISRLRSIRPTRRSPRRLSRGTHRREVPIRIPRTARRPRARLVPPSRRRRRGNGAAPIARSTCSRLTASRSGRDPSPVPIARPCALPTVSRSPPGRARSRTRPSPRAAQRRGDAPRAFRVRGETRGVALSSPPLRSPRASPPRRPSSRRASRRAA